MPFTPALPDHASPASRVRFDLACRLAALCPHDLGAAIALTGSAARGLAEAGSDAEINFYVEQLPPLSTRADWLMEAGVTAVQVEPAPRSDGSEWFAAALGGVPIEAGWQTFAALEGSLAPLLAGETTVRDRLRLGEIIVSAVVLRPNLRLLNAQRELAAYPDALRDRLLAELTALLTDEGRWAAAETLARRGERVTLMQVLTDALRTALHLLFVVNRRWEAGDKWLLTMAAALPLMPDDWRPRLDAALSTPPVQALALTRNWCDDALELAG